ncbi:g1360 [Coccomyxa viridis]|uniref:G1360 protein n=1 Tax=Coccomyxa viridis TaxID=1274662 RepID=A0ABP1FHU2_9CHLO
MGGCVSSQSTVKEGPDHQKYSANRQQEDGSLREKASLASQRENGKHAPTSVNQEWPLPVSEAPSEVGLHGRAQLPYAAPYIPGPGLPPPDYKHLAGVAQRWQPARRAAVLVGVNYLYARDQNSRLRGSVNDIHCLKHLLMRRFGFQADDIVLLHDAQPHPEYWPTKDNIREAVQWLVRDSQAQDSLVFAFSGHGCMDVSHDQERDGILPSDYEKVGPIYDDELAKQLVRPLPEGARLHCLVDACKGVFALGLPSRTYTRADGWSAWEEDEHGPDGAYLHPSTGGEAIMLSSSLGEEDDADADLAELSTHASMGAVVFALTQAVEQGHAATYNTLLRAMRHSLKNGPQHFAKIPELSASWDFDLNRSFLL